MGDGVWRGACAEERLSLNFTAEFAVQLRQLLKLTMSTLGKEPCDRGRKRCLGASFPHERLADCSQVDRPGVRYKSSTALEATLGQMDGFFSQLPYKCYLEEVASVGN